MSKRSLVCALLLLVACVGRPSPVGAQTAKQTDAARIEALKLSQMCAEAGEKYGASAMADPSWSGTYRTHYSRVLERCIWELRHFKLGSATDTVHIFQLADPIENVSLASLIFSIGEHGKTTLADCHITTTTGELADCKRDLSYEVAREIYEQYAFNVLTH